ncbi:MAG: peptidoglycan DD-metalloendopeptidase family protein [Patescibacteria group bacterium]
MPLSAEASFLTSIFGHTTSASAQGVDVSNSQTIALLEANVSPVPTPGKKDEPQETTDNDNISSDTALVPSTSPLGVSDGSPDIQEFSDEQVSVYMVKKGDSISQIADMYDVSVNTILWANDMKKGDRLVEGEVLTILPVSGLEHTVTKGQTLQSIAKLYKADAGEIADYNGLAENAPLTVGDKLLIPNAEKSDEGDKPIQNLGASIAKDQQYYVNHPIQNLAGYFVNPVPGARKSQGIHDHNAVDLATASGSTVYASASGVVLLAKTGCVKGNKRCGGGFGNYVVINHANGTQTLYAHLLNVATKAGSQVSQGQPIGNVGSTGHSTGPHLHFEVHGARNPGADASWKS